MKLIYIDIICKNTYLICKSKYSGVNLDKAKAKSKSKAWTFQNQLNTNFLHKLAVSRLVKKRLMLHN